MRRIKRKNTYDTTPRNLRSYNENGTVIHKNLGVGMKVNIMAVSTGDKSVKSIPASELAAQAHKESYYKRKARQQIYRNLVDGDEVEDTAGPMLKR